MQQFADGRAIHAKHFQAFVQMIGHHKTRHRIDLQVGLDLVDARFLTLGTHQRGRIHQTQQPTRRPQQTRGNHQHTGTVFARGARGRDDGGQGTSSVRPNTSSKRARVRVMHPASTE